MDKFRLKSYDPQKYGKSLLAGTHTVKSIECDDYGVHYVLGEMTDEHFSGYSICIDPRTPNKIEINYTPTLEEELEDEERQIREAKRA
jgi:hypothetical protein